MVGAHVSHHDHRYMWALGIAGVGGVGFAAATGALPKIATFAKHHAENCPGMKLCRSWFTKKKESRLKFWAR